MKIAKVQIPWEKGLHIRPAAQLAQLAARFESGITLRFGKGVAEATNVLSILALCAYMGAPVEVAASGFDEAEAIAEVTSFFDGTDGDSVVRSTG